MATLDRVLNGRPGVRPKTIAKVNETIEAIGYERNMQAANLARKKNYTFEFILPDNQGRFLEELMNQIEAANSSLSFEMTSARVKQLPTNDPHQVANYLSSLSCEEIDGVAVMIPEAPQVRDALSRLSERDIKVIRFLSGQPKGLQVDCVGIDNQSAGATAGALVGRFVGPSDGDVLVISETMQSRDSIERRLGFDKVMAADFPHLTALPSIETHGSSARTDRIILQSLKSHPNIKAVYIISSEAELPVKALEKHAHSKKPVVIAHERTSFTEGALKAGQMDAVIDQHAGHAIRSAIRIMRARSENREPSTSQETIRIEILLKENL